ncbi:hypothetical protein JCM18899A_41140 [Nocardioides sp. AN3]
MDRSWPVLAGALVAVGGVSLMRAWSIAGLVAVAVITWAFVAALVYGLLSDFDVPTDKGIWLATVVTVASLDLMGLLLLSPMIGSAAALVAAATSPLVTDRRLAILRRSASRASQKTVDRRFAHIVAELDDDPSWRAGA